MIQDHEPHCDTCGMMLARSDTSCYNCGVAVDGTPPVGAMTDEVPCHEDAQPILEILLYPDRDGHYRARVRSSGYVNETVYTRCSDKQDALHVLADWLDADRLDPG